MRSPLFSCLLKAPKCALIIAVLGDEKGTFMTVLKLIGKYLGKVKFYFVLSFILYIVSFSSARINSYFSAQLVGLVAEFDADTMPMATGCWLLAAFGVTTLMGSFFLCLAHFAEAKFEPKFLASMHKDLFMQVHEHSLRFFNEEKSGNIERMVSSISQGINGLKNSTMTLVMNLCTVSVTILIIAFMNFYLALFFLIVTLFFAWLTSIIRKIILKNMQNVTESEAELGGVYMDTVMNAATVKAFANEKYERRYFFQRLKKWLRFDRDEKCTRAKLNYRNNFIYDMMSLTFYVATFFAWKYSSLSVADIVFILTSVQVLMMSTKRLSYDISAMFRDYGQIKSGVDFIYAPHEVVDAPDAKDLKLRKAEIKFENVDFAYPGKALLFHDFNLLIANGQKIGLVGKSGSGKSTLVKLLARYYDLQKGKITINGKDIAKVKQMSLRKNIAFIPQDPLLFNRTLMENIRYGNVNATDEEVMKAAKEAYCDVFIKDLPEGYQSKVGDKGVLLSGGERQRIAIARAILSKAPILVLDEATSALDSESEVYIQKSLAKLMKGKTVIAIAHRLSTLKNMDEIVVLQKGKIVEQGSQAALLKKKGVFHHLYQLQSEGFLQFEE